MKYKLIFTILILFFYAQADAKSFSGLYGSLGIGMAQPNFDVSQNITIDTAFFTTTLASSAHITENALSGNASIGYSKLIKNKIFLGIEAYSEFSNTSSILTNRVMETNSGLSAHVSTSVMLRKQFAMLLKLGYIFSPHTLFYGLVGPAWGDFKVDGSGSYNQSAFGITSSAQGTSARYQDGILAGLGIAYLMSQTFSMGIQYTYSFYDAIRITANGAVSGAPIPGSTFQFNTHVNPNVSNIMFIITAYF